MQNLVQSGPMNSGFFFFFCFLLCFVLFLFFFNMYSSLLFCGLKYSPKNTIPVSKIQNFFSFWGRHIPSDTSVQLSLKFHKIILKKIMKMLIMDLRPCTDHPEIQPCHLLDRYYNWAEYSLNKQNLWHFKNSFLPKFFELKTSWDWLIMAKTVHIYIQNFGSCLLKMPVAIRIGKQVALSWLVCPIFKRTIGIAEISI